VDVDRNESSNLGVTTEDDDALLGVSSSRSLFLPMVGRGGGGEWKGGSVSRGEWALGDAVLSWLMLYWERSNLGDSEGSFLAG